LSGSAVYRALSGATLLRKKLYAKPTPSASARGCRMGTLWSPRNLRGCGTPSPPRRHSGSSPHRAGVNSAQCYQAEAVASVVRGSEREQAQIRRSPNPHLRNASTPLRLADGSSISATAQILSSTTRRQSPSNPESDRFQARSMSDLRAVSPTLRSILEIRVFP